MNRQLSLSIWVLVCGFALFIRPVMGDDDVLPGNGFSASRYEVLWTKSPFAVATAEAAPESPDYALKGAAQFDGVSYVTLIDKKSQEHFLLSSEKPVRGLKLLSLARGKTAADTAAVIDRNGESLTLKLDISDTSFPAGGNVVAGQTPNAPPPQIPMPGAQGAAGGGNVPGLGTYGVPTLVPRPGMGMPGEPSAGQVPPPVTIRPRVIHIPSNPAFQPQPQTQPAPSK